MKLSKEMPLVILVLLIHLKQLHQSLHQQDLLCHEELLDKKSNPHQKEGSI